MMVEFAQAELDGREIPDGLKVVRAHIDQCRCCKAEYRALMNGYPRKRFYLEVLDLAMMYGAISEKHAILGVWRNTFRNRGNGKQ